MLFYIKKYLSLELLSTILFFSIGLFFIDYLSIEFSFKFKPIHILFGLLAFFAISAWNFIVMYGYVVFKGQKYVDDLKAAFQKHFSDSSFIVAVFGGLTAALGEEVFFRGFLQNYIGLVPASLVFMLLHFGNKEVRVFGFWSFFQSLLLGYSYLLFNPDYTLGFVMRA